MALDTAQDLGHNHVSPEHLLLALANEPEGVAARILTDLEVSSEALRAEVLSLMDK